MDLTIVVSIIGLGVGLLQGVVIFILNGMRKDHEEMWGRINSHYHEITCSNDDCRNLKTGNVIIPGRS
jgi:hypothetical protein